MITLSQTDYGFRLTFASPMSLAETEKWRDEILSLVSKLDGSFGVFIDMIKLNLVPTECKAIIEEVQLYCKTNGLERSVMIFEEDLTLMQLRVIAGRTGIREWERYIIASKTPDWETIGDNWIRHAVEPDSSVQQCAST